MAPRRDQEDRRSRMDRPDWWQYLLRRARPRVARRSGGSERKTVFGYECLLRSRILPGFGKHRLRQIKRGEVRAWIAAMDSEGLSPSRIRQAHQVLCASLDQAVQDRKLSGNPAAGMRLPRLQRRDMLVLTSEEVHRLASTICATRRRPSRSLAAGTSRPSRGCSATRTRR